MARLDVTRAPVQIQIDLSVMATATIQMLGWRALTVAVQDVFAGAARLMQTHGRADQEEKIRVFVELVEDEIAAATVAQEIEQRAGKLAADMASAKASTDQEWRERMDLVFADF